MLRANGRLAVYIPEAVEPDAKAFRLYRAIATMDKSAPLPPLLRQKPTWGTAAALARDWQLNKLAERLAALAAKGAS